MTENDSTNLDQLRASIAAALTQARVEQALATLTRLREIAEEDDAAGHIIRHPAGAADAYRNAEHLIRTALNEETT